MSLSDRLTTEIEDVIQARVANLVIGLTLYAQATNATPRGMTHSQLSDIVNHVLTAFSGVRGEIQGVVEIDAVLLTRGVDALRAAEADDA